MPGPHSFPPWVLIGTVLVLYSMISFLREQKEALIYPQRELLQRSCEASFPTETSPTPWFHRKEGDE